MALAPEDPAEITDPEAARIADRIDVLLEKMGFSSGQGTRWWLHVPHDELGGLTAMQAWQRGMHEQVLCSVETYVSRKFTSALSAKPSVRNRLLVQPDP